jgi:hypothetical protein
VDGAQTFTAVSHPHAYPTANVARQREQLARLKSLGCSTLVHEQTLDVFLSSLEIFVDHERNLRGQSQKRGHGKTTATVPPPPQGLTL